MLEIFYTWIDNVLQQMILCINQLYVERNGLTIGGVTEDVLSVIDCDSSVEGTHLVQLDWHHSTLYEENHKLDRIFLFSHCINPTNTSLVRKI